MAQFVRCPSCAFCIAPYIEFFDKAREATYLEHVFANAELKDYDPEKLALNPGTSAELKNIFDALNIENRCCRMRILTSIKFDMLYK